MPISVACEIGDHARLHVMLDADAVQQRLDLFDAEFAVRRGNRKQFAAGEFLRRATLVNVHVRSLSAKDRVMRFRDRFQAEHVRARAAKDEIDRDVAAEMFLKQL